jgi:DNA-binding MarR family transcriptional regulator
MSLSEMQVLIVVVRSDSITPRGIADELRMTSSNVAAALRVLESSGLVVRAKDPHDGRQVNLSATPNATALMARFRNERDTWLGRAISTQLTAEELTVLARAGELMERLAHFEAPPDNR